MDDVKRRGVAPSTTYITDDHYVRIRDALPEEWFKRACDLIYLLSHRPGGVLSLRETDIVDNEICFTTRKTDQDMEIEANSDLIETIEWFRAWKRQQNIHSPHLVCYPRHMARRFIGKPVPVEYLSRRFTDAVETAGFARGTYTLRDLRPKGLTDEFEVAGDSDKGGHKTETMKCRYRRKRLPMRAKSNLKLPESG